MKQDELLEFNDQKISKLIYQLINGEITITDIVKKYYNNQKVYIKGKEVSLLDIFIDKSNTYTDIEGIESIVSEDNDSNGILLGYLLINDMLSEKCLNCVVRNMAHKKIYIDPSCEFLKNQPKGENNIQFNCVPYTSVLELVMANNKLRKKIDIKHIENAPIHIRKAEITVKEYYRLLVHKLQDSDNITQEQQESTRNLLNHLQKENIPDKVINDILDLVFPEPDTNKTYDVKGYLLSKVYLNKDLPEWVYENFYKETIIDSEDYIAKDYIIKNINNYSRDSIMKIKKYIPLGNVERLDFFDEILIQTRDINEETLMNLNNYMPTEGKKVLEFLLENNKIDLEKVLTEYYNDSKIMTILLSSIINSMTHDSLTYEEKKELFKEEYAKINKSTNIYEILMDIIKYKNYKIFKSKDISSSIDNIYLFINLNKISDYDLLEMIANIDIDVLSVLFVKFDKMRIYRLRNNIASKEYTDKYREIISKINYQIYIMDNFIDINKLNKISTKIDEMISFFKKYHINVSKDTILYALEILDSSMFETNGIPNTTLGLSENNSNLTFIKYRENINVLLETIFHELIHHFSNHLTYTEKDKEHLVIDKSSKTITGIEYNFQLNEEDTIGLNESITEYITKLLFSNDDSAYNVGALCINELTTELTKEEIGIDEYEFELLDEKDYIILDEYTLINEYFHNSSNHLTSKLDELGISIEDFIKHFSYIHEKYMNESKKNKLDEELTNYIEQIKQAKIKQVKQKIHDIENENNIKRK